MAAKPGDFAAGFADVVGILLAMRFPNAAAGVERTEVESKFFRSVVALLVMSLSLYWAQLTGPGRAVGLLLIALSFSRYSERRWKSNQLAFAFLVVDAATPQVRTAAGGMVDGIGVSG